MSEIFDVGGKRIFQTLNNKEILGRWYQLILDGLNYYVLDYLIQCTYMVAHCNYIQSTGT